jgi:hypothetical protein
MVGAFAVIALLVLAGNATLLHSAASPSDAPAHPHDSTGPVKAGESYEQAIQIWKTPEDVNAWIAANFSYDGARALRLSETQRARGEPFEIYRPHEFFEKKAGVCVDLSRFGVETLRRIDPPSDPMYLLIEFDPIHIAGNILRFHWLVSFRREGKRYFFADSNRSGHIAGPYEDAREFVEDYARSRGREIVSFRELASYQKQRRTPALKRQAAEKRR